jgi:hypothetical protein
MTKSKLSQGELVQNCLVKSPAPLIDVGVNLVDHSFDKASSNCQVLITQKDPETAARQDVTAFPAFPAATKQNTERCCRSSVCGFARGVLRLTHCS